MLERAKQVPRRSQYTDIEYCRLADDLVILVDAYPQHAWLRRAVTPRRRLRFQSETVAPSSKPRSSRSTSPARNTGASSSTGRHKAIACTWMAARATGVSTPARSSYVRKVARLSPRASDPSAFWTTPLPSYVPVSTATSTRVVSRRYSRLPWPRRA